MKAIKQNHLWIIIIVILLIVVSVLYILKPFKSAGQRRYEACLNESQDMRPNGCAPPGYCDAPNDGYIECDE